MRVEGFGSAKKFHNFVSESSLIELKVSRSVRLPVVCLERSALVRGEVRLARMSPVLLTAPSHTRLCSTTHIRFTPRN